MAAEPTKSRDRPLVLVATPDADLSRLLADEMRASGSVVCIARSAMGCLRVATAIGPDLVLLDASLPSNLEGMLHSHPATAASEVVRLGSKRAAEIIGSRAASAPALKVA